MIICTIKFNIFKSTKKYIHAAVQPSPSSVSGIFSSSPFEALSPLNSNIIFPTSYPQQLCFCFLHPWIWLASLCPVSLIVQCMYICVWLISRSLTENHLLMQISTHNSNTINWNGALELIKALTHLSLVCLIATLDTVSASPMKKMRWGKSE